MKTRDDHWHISASMEAQPTLQETYLASLIDDRLLTKVVRSEYWRQWTAETASTHQAIHDLTCKQEHADAGFFHLFHAHGYDTQLSKPKGRRTRRSRRTERRLALRGARARLPYLVAYLHEIGEVGGAHRFLERVLWDIARGRVEYRGLDAEVKR